MTSSNNTQTNSSGIGFFGAMFLTFLVLKLVHVVDWEWVWVFAPLWVPALFVVGYIVAVGVVLFAKLLITAAIKKVRA
ncbi:hypothetical protein [Nocardia niwae]|uniref:hypothetical protein n=1 Tax=Nocardia niwae TaxID=626084 RepID=UPI0007A38EAC|nr:hypothetical protein [Nocardia niwae]